MVDGAGDRIVVAGQAFRHEARFYAGDAELVAGALRFIREGLARGEPVMVALPLRKIELLEPALNGDGGRVIFRDMDEVGANPAHSIPAWQRFLDDHARANRIRGIGEPIGPKRAGADLVEAHIHEALINSAFASADGFLLECPYDELALAPDVIAAAKRTHPHRNPEADCAEYAPPDTLSWDVLSPPAADATRFEFGERDLHEVRSVVATAARCAGLSEPARGDLVLAANELATNTLRHGSRTGTLLVWRESATLYCQVDDTGRIDDPMVGRIQPRADHPQGRGLWLANHVCDLVQIRSGDHGTSVRLHISASRRRPTS